MPPFTASTRSVVQPKKRKPNIRPRGYGENFATRPARGMDPLGLEYRRIDADDPAVAGLIARHAAHGDAHYPAESNHHQDGAAMAAEGVTLFAGLRDGIAVRDGRLQGHRAGRGRGKNRCM